jgi:hypothetical protein
MTSIASSVAPVRFSHTYTHTRLSTRLDIQKPGDMESNNQQQQQQRLFRLIMSSISSSFLVFLSAALSLHILLFFYISSRFKSFKFRARQSRKKGETEEPGIKKKKTKSKKRLLRQSCFVLNIQTICYSYKYLLFCSNNLFD